MCRGGAPATQTCAAGSACLGHACVALTAPDGSALARERLRTPGGEGWINAWSAVTPLARKAVDGYLAARDPEALGGPKAFRPICARDGFVTPRTRAVDKNDGQILSLSSAIVLSDARHRLRLWASVSGKVRVLVGDSEVISIDETKGIDGRPLVDERSSVVELPRGASDLTAVLEAPSDPERVGGFYLRFRELDGGAPAGVAFAERFEACASNALVDPGADLDVDASGLLLHLKPSYRGLVPFAHDLFPISVELSSGPKAVTTIDATEAGDVALAAPEKGGFTVRAMRAAGGAEPLFSRTLPAYGALVGRVAKLVAGITAAQASAKLPSGSKDSFEHHVRSLAGLVAKGDTDLPFLDRHAKTAEGLLERIVAGEDPYASETGVVHRAYRSKLDGKLQPYVAFVPKSQRKGKPQPLVLIYHGRNRLPEHALRTLVGEAPDDHMTLRFAERNLPAFPDQGALLVAPWGYDEGGPHPLGEDDLLRVVSEMSSAYAVDPRRVSLTGYSLGGTVAFVAPLHHPDVFSAAAPLCGYPNLLGYSSVASVPHAPWEDTLLAKKYIVNYAENGAYLPLTVVHGGKDGPGRSKVVIDRYKSLGYSYNFDVQDDLDHDVWDYAYEDSRMVPWLTGRSVPKSPKRVRFVSGEYRYDHAYWVRLLGMSDGASAKLASIDARLDDKASRIEVTTANVSALAIDRSAIEPTATWCGAVSVAIDGETIAAPAGSGPLYLERGDRWALAAEPPKREGMKRHGVSGPLDDVLRHAIVVVYGTRVAQHAEVNRVVAAHMARAGGVAEVSYPIMSDAEALADGVAGKSLVLVGSPSENLFTAKLADGLPIRFDGSTIVVRGKRFEGEGVGVSFIAPRPGEAEEYVVVHAGLDEAGMLASRFLPRYLPDYVVYDARTSSERGGLLFGSRPFLAGGFFDEHWQ